MAAYAALVSLFNDLQLIPNHLIHSFSFDDEQLSSLSQTVEFLIDFMESYDSHGCTTEATEALESRIATAAHAAHDVIQSHVVNQIHAGSTRRGKVRSYFLLDLQKAMDNMEFVKRKTMQLIKARSGSKPEQPTYSSKATTSSEPLKNAMVGFDEVVLRLLGILTGEPSDQRLVIPIAGMGGLGKTSLAKTVYEHSSLEHHFDVRLWATISQQYSAQSILTELNISTTCGNVNVSELGEELRKNKLWNRRYLIVLDDMWSLEAWNEVKMYLPENGNGSRVVVTTRLSDLAACLSSSPSSPFKLNFLDEDKSWELFCGKTFGEEDCPVELEEIGKKIVKRCRGLPLTIVVIGGHLRKSSWTIEYWEKVAGYMDPISSIGEEKQCLEILSLSYQYLPAHLKPCFLYLATFKEDEAFDAEKLLQYWVAEGFLKPKEGLSLEEVGEDCLKDLVDRNLIFVHELNYWRAKYKYYKIHDTMRELCLKACKKEKFLCVVEDSTQATIHRERRLMILEREKFNSEMIGAKQSAPPLYSLVNKGGRDSFLSELLVDCKLLRVLVHEDKDADDLSSTCLPLSHVHQVNLRALAFNNWNGGNFSKTAYSILSSISAACWNFQTLRMAHYSEPIILPYEIWEMPQLRHIRINEIFLPDPACCPGSAQQECIVLQNLHTLGHVVNLRLTEEVCKRMPNLEKLSLRYDHLCDDYCFHNLGRFNKLKRLWIRFDNNSTWRDVLLSLTFPTSLEVLWLMNSQLRWEDLTIMISSLPLLEFLQVRLVSGSEWNLDKEEFYCLKTLEIFNCRDLISLNANPANFPVLETLSLRNLPKLSEIPLDIGEIPTLRLIELEDCSASAAVSAMIMVIEQETSGNSDLQLYVRFWEYNREECERFQEMLQEECLTSNSLHLYYRGKKIKTF